MKNWRCLWAIMAAAAMCLFHAAETHAAYALPRYGDVVQDLKGNAISGAMVYVYLANTKTLATLYSTDNVAGARKSNPTTTDASGRFWFYAEINRYDIMITRYGITDYTIEDVWLMVGYPEELAAGDIGAPVITNIVGSAVCDAASGYVTLAASAISDERARFNLGYRVNDGTWTTVDTTGDLYAYPTLVREFSVLRACLFSDVYQVRVGAVDSTGNATAWLDTLSLQIPEDEPVITTSITMGLLTVHDGDLVAHVTGTSSAPAFYRKLFRKSDTVFEDTTGMSWSVPAVETIIDSLHTAWPAPVASDDSTITVAWEPASGPLASYRLEYRWPPSSIWTVLHSLIPAEVECEFVWNEYSITDPRRGPVDMRICAVDSGGNLSAYAYLDEVYYNQSEYVEARYDALADTTSSYAGIASSTSGRIYLAKSGTPVPQRAPLISGLTIASADSVDAGGYKVRARLIATVDSAATVASISHKWGYAASWGDTFGVSLAQNMDHQYATGDTTRSDSLWVRVRVWKNDKASAYVRAVYFVERDIPAGEEEFNYLFEVSSGDSSSYGYAGRTIVDVSADDEYWWVRGGADSTLTSIIGSTTSYLQLRARSVRPALRDAYRGNVVCFHWPAMGDLLSDAVTIDTFRIHVYMSTIADSAFTAADSFVIGFITNTDMLEPVDGVNDNTTGQYVDNNLATGEIPWSVSPLYVGGPSYPEGWGPGAWEYVTIPGAIASTHYEFDITPAIVEAAIGSGTWDGTFTFWVTALNSAHYFRPYSISVGDKWRRPSIIVRGSR